MAVKLEEKEILSLPEWHCHYNNLIGANVLIPVQMKDLVGIIPVQLVTLVTTPIFIAPARTFDLTFMTILRCVPCPSHVDLSAPC